MQLPLLDATSGIVMLESTIAPRFIACKSCGATFHLSLIKKGRCCYCRASAEPVQRRPSRRSPYSVWSDLLYQMAAEGRTLPADLGCNRQGRE